MAFQKRKDVKFGMDKENNLLEHINEHFELDLHKLPRLHPFDFTDENSDNHFELKSRRCMRYTFSETMVGHNKILYIKEHPNRNYYFVFSFTDGLYYIKYNEELFNTFRVQVGGRCDRGEPEYKDHIYIPVEYLLYIGNV